MSLSVAGMRLQRYFLHLFLQGVQTSEWNLAGVNLFLLMFVSRHRSSLLLKPDGCSVGELSESGSNSTGGV